MTITDKQAAPIIWDQAEAARTWLWDSWRPSEPISDLGRIVVSWAPVCDGTAPLADASIHPVLRGEAEVSP